MLRMQRYGEKEQERFNRRACMDESASPRPPTDRYDTTAQPSFQPCGRERL